jgi:predicted CXXCH cytochrome family protein
MSPERWKRILRGALGIALICAAGGGALLFRGFRANSEPSSFEAGIARTARDFAIPRSAKREQSPIEATSENLNEGRDQFVARCANCHGNDADGKTPVGVAMYPRVPDLHSARTQDLTDGELHYIIENGVQLTGMPAMAHPRGENAADSWKLVQFIRSLRPFSKTELAENSKIAASAHYVGSAACQKCHAQIYDRWKKTPMANVVRDPREHPDAIIPDLATNKIAPFRKEQVAFVYGSIWKQRYFTKVGGDYFPLGAQWDVGNKTWRPYHVPNTGDWWTAFYPDDNMKRPTGPTCDGCHSVDYNIHTKQVAEWNVGCERCHGPGSMHAEHPTRANIISAARMNSVDANDTCIQCHSQGRPLASPIEGTYYDWPVGYNVGLKLKDYWQLEGHALGEASFTHFPDGTAHKNRMQGNDYVQSVMYRRGVTCSSCHDTHGTENYAQLRKPADKLCLDCHGPLSPNGPRAATLAQHTHHKDGSAGSECIACHMPKIETEGVPGSFVRAHTFGFITPAMTDKYKIPNACTSCHTEKSPAWATEALRAWSNHSPWRAE